MLNNNHRIVPMRLAAAQSRIHPADPAANQENGTEMGKLMRRTCLMGNVVNAKLPDM